MGNAKKIAKRITAAPPDHVLTELLQACESVCDLLDQPDADERSATIARARAAIAQAQAVGVYSAHEPGRGMGGLKPGEKPRGGPEH